jgi:hypothetical protein
MKTPSRFRDMPSWQRVHTYLQKGLASFSCIRLHACIGNCHTRTVRKMTVFFIPAVMIILFDQTIELRYGAVHSKKELKNTHALTGTTKDESGQSSVSGKNMD